MKARESRCLLSNATAATVSVKAAAPMSPRFRVAAAEFRITKGTPRRYIGKADSGNEITRVFCPDCGSPLYVQVSTRPDLVGVRVASFDDPSWFRPEADIFVQSAQPWDHMNPDIPKYPTYPPGMSYPAGSEGMTGLADHGVKLSAIALAIDWIQMASLAA